jgi:hypothetical protein
MRHGACEPLREQRTRFVVCAHLAVGVGLVTVLTALSGCGEERFSVRPAYFAASTDVIDFGEVDVGDERTQTVYLINKGEKEMRVETPRGDMLGGTFAILLNDMIVPAGGDVIARIVFSPHQARDFETTAAFANDSSNERSFNLTIRGKGVTGDPCDNVTCNSPPASVCLNSSTSRTFAPPGTCSNGQCSYTTFDETCSTGCNSATGRCNGDPCAGVVCQTPPNSCYKAQGTCVGGSCTYPLNDGAQCSDGNTCTTGDACSEGTCRGTPVVCNTPPVDGCVNSGTRRVWDPQGSCNAGGSCDYVSHDYPCQFGCSEQACQGDPCLVLNCDDGNPCTTDSCQSGVGCKHVNVDNVACTTGSYDCPQGTCSNGNCFPRQGALCTAEYDVDLCSEVEVPGWCTSNGECVVTEPPPEYTCPDCNGICIRCLIFQFCIPLF